MEFYRLWGVDWQRNRLLLENTVKVNFASHESSSSITEIIGPTLFLLHGAWKQTTGPKKPPTQMLQICSVTRFWTLKDCFVGFNAFRSFLESVDGDAAACNELTSEAAGCDEGGLDMWRSGYVPQQTNRRSLPLSAVDSWPASLLVLAPNLVLTFFFFFFNMWKKDFPPEFSAHSC